MPGMGRADRVALESRLAIARRGAGLLDRKQRILEDELERMTLAADRQRDEWVRATREADRWLARAAALDGADGIASAAPTARAEARLSWETTMGVRFPAEADCALPAAAPVGGSSALVFAARAHRAATVAAVRQAAAEEAVRLIGAELASTRVRGRAVEKRWIPRLTAEAAAIARRLDDLELEESLRLRWSVEHVAAAGAGTETPAPAAPGEAPPSERENP